MKKLTILMADNSEFSVELAKTFLKRLECDFLTCDDGGKVLEIMKVEQPGIVIMSLNLSGTDAYKCCEIIRSDPATKNTPVIMLVSDDGKFDKDRLDKLGAIEYMSRPVNKVQLLEKISRLGNIQVRETHRAPISTEILYYSGGKWYSGQIYIISEGGMYIKGEHILEAGAPVKMQFTIAEISELIDAEGEVVWTSNERSDIPSMLIPGMGIKFTNVKDEGAVAISTYVNLGNYLQ